MSGAYKDVDWDHRRDVIKAHMTDGVAYRAWDLGRDTQISASMVGYALRRDPRIQVIESSHGPRFIKMGACGSR
jgi:hypothetical protein